MSDANREAFLNMWEAEYRKDRAANPSYYVGDTDEVVARMGAAIVAGTFSKESYAISRTCRHFGIKHTYRAIREFIKEDAP
jgi:hypothetical protein